MKIFYKITLKTIQLYAFSILQHSFILHKKHIGIENIFVNVNMHYCSFSIFCVFTRCDIENAIGRLENSTQIILKCD